MCNDVIVKSRIIETVAAYLCFVMITSLIVNITLSFVAFITCVQRLIYFETIYEVMRMIFVFEVTLIYRINCITSLDVNSQYFFIYPWFIMRIQIIVDNKMKTHSTMAEVEDSWTFLCLL